MKQNDTIMKQASFTSSIVLLAFVVILTYAGIKEINKQYSKEE